MPLCMCDNNNNNRRLSDIILDNILRICSTHSITSVYFVQNQAPKVIAFQEVIRATALSSSSFIFGISRDRTEPQINKKRSIKEEENV